MLRIVFRWAAVCLVMLGVVGCSGMERLSSAAPAKDSSLRLDGVTYEVEPANVYGIKQDRGMSGYVADELIGAGAKVPEALSFPDIKVVPIKGGCEINVRGHVASSLMYDDAPHSAVKGPGPTSQEARAYVHTKMEEYMQRSIFK